MCEKIQANIDKLDGELNVVTNKIAEAIRTGIGYHEAISEKKKVIKKYLSFILKLNEKCNKDAKAT